MATPFLPVRTLKAAADRAAYSVLSIETAQTQPVPVKTEHGTSIQILYFTMSGRPPAAPKIGPPTHAMWLDGTSAKVQRFWATSPDDLGFPDPLPKVPGISGGDPGDPDIDAEDDDESKSFVVELERFQALSPEVWGAFAAGSTSVSAETRDRVSEYFQLFLSLTNPDVAPYYTCGAPDFFAWIHAVLTGP